MQNTPKVHRVPRGTMPPTIFSGVAGTVDKVLQGGLPPVPYRTTYTKLTGYHKSTQRHTQQWRDNRSHGQVATYVGAWAQAKLA